MIKNKFEEITKAMADKGVPHQYFELLADIHQEIGNMEELAGEAYQIIGSLADSANLFDHPEVQKILDKYSDISAGNKNTESMLPFRAANIHQYSVETLYHFNCWKCGMWWSIGDFNIKEKSWLCCPYCETTAHLEEKQTDVIPD